MNTAASFQKDKFAALSYLIPKKIKEEWLPIWSLGYKVPQGSFNVWWHEHGIILHTEFRDGNVPAGFEQLRIFKEALNCLPENVEKVKLRSDTAGYQHDLLKYCEKA